MQNKKKHFGVNEKTSKILKLTEPYVFHTNNSIVTNLTFKR